jgi:dienelactone hydrolase
VDQRSGDAVNGVTNETAARAKAKKLGREYLDAEPDILAAVNWAANRSGKPVILVGSSYSASLALKVAKENANVRAVAAFSPGEYFGAKLNLGKTIAGLDKPAFVTASKSEMPKTEALAAHIRPEKLVLYTPTTDGYHGSRALWTEKPGHEGYRAAFLRWLETIKNEE